MNEYFESLKEIGFHHLDASDYNSVNPRWVTSFRVRFMKTCWFLHSYRLSAYADYYGSYPPPIRITKYDFQKDQMEIRSLEDFIEDLSDPKEQEIILFNLNLFVGVH